MVHPHDHLGIDGAVLFHGVDDSDDGTDKHLTHLSQAADWCLIERSKQNKHVVCNKDDDVEDLPATAADDAQVEELSDEELLGASTLAKVEAAQAEEEQKLLDEG